MHCKNGFSTLQDFNSCKDTDIVPEASPLIVLDIKSTLCMPNNGKDAKHTRHIPIRVHFVINGKNCKMHKIDWCEGVFDWNTLQLRILERII